MRIGIFDSGLGGLNILKKCHTLLPEYDYLYYADNKHIPYGDKSHDQIVTYTKHSLVEMFKNDCKIVILACNTATAHVLRHLQQNWLLDYFPDRKILGVIRPAVETIVESNVQIVGVLATIASVQSNAFEDELKKLNPDIKVIQQACPLFVPQIETMVRQSRSSSSVAHIIVSANKYITPLLQEHVDSILLGCTHYEFIGDEIRSLLPSSISLITEGTMTAIKFNQYLSRHPEIERDLSKTNSVMYMNSKNDAKYNQLMKHI